MKSVLRKNVKCLPLIAITMGLLLATPVADFIPHAVTAAHAQEDKKPERRTRKVVAMREKILRKIQEVQQLLEDKTVADNVKFPQAKKMLDEVREEKDLNSAELTTMWNFYAYLALSQDDYPGAIRAYERIVNVEDADPRLVTSIMYNLAQLYMATEQYQKSITTMKKWLTETDTPTSQAYVIIGQAYYQLENYKKSLPAIKKAVDMSLAKGEEPKENWYQLLRALYYELGMKVKAKDVLELLTSKYAKKNYWLQLSQIYGELNRDDDQLAAIEIAYRAGMLNSESELMNLAQLLMYRGVPYKGAQVIEKGMKTGQIEKTADHYETLSRALLNAMEYKDATRPLEIAASEAKDGDLYLRLARVFTQLDEPKKAVNAVANALKKGGLKHSDDAYVLKGMAEYELKRYNDAIASFKNAAKTKRSQKMAKNWIKYISDEQTRITTMKKFLEN